MGDALPDVADGKGSGFGTGAVGEAQEGKIKHKSLRSRPGANKKKEKLVAMEMERFAKNMALMSAAPTSSKNIGIRASNRQEMVGVEGDGKMEGVKGGTAARWAAIRGFISQTMERRGDGEGVVGG